MEEKKSAEAVSVLVSTNSWLIRAFQRQRKFDVVLTANVAQDVWSQVDEVLTASGKDADGLKIEFVVLGVIGTRSEQEIAKLAEHGSVEWMPGASLFKAAKALEIAKKVKILESSV